MTFCSPPGLQFPKQRDALQVLGWLEGVGRSEHSKSFVVHNIFHDFFVQVKTTLPSWTQSCPSWERRSDHGIDVGWVLNTVILILIILLFIIIVLIIFIIIVIKLSIQSQKKLKLSRQQDLCVKNFPDKVRKSRQFSNSRQMPVKVVLARS